MTAARDLDEEIAYLRSQRLARVATVSNDGQTDVVPVGYEFDGTHLYVGGLDPVRNRKFRNMQAGNPKVALVIDDLVSAQPWTPRYLRIYGTAELVEQHGRFGRAPYLRITPTISWSWNLEGRPFTLDCEVVVQRTVHEAAAERGLVGSHHPIGWMFEAPRRSKERDVRDANDWNEKIIAEFRANEGRVGGPFEGAPVVLVHHRGRKSGREYVDPVMYLPDDSDDDTIYVFATKGGAPSNPDWYYNLIAAGESSVERGTDTYRVTVRELSGDERDRIYEEQARRYPGFADYAQQTAGIRTIPVLELRRS